MTTIDKIEGVKLAVLNYSGNVGKTTICNTLLFPRIKDSKIIRVETVNYDGDGNGVGAQHYTSIIKEIAISDSCIVDVGSSNIEKFIQGMLSHKGSYEELDYFIIPVTPDSKQIRDTVNIYNFLVFNGVSPDSIKIVLNRVEEDHLNKSGELHLFENTALCDICDIYSLPVIYESEYYPELSRIKKTHEEIVSTDRDFKAERKLASSAEERWDIVQEQTLYRQALSAEDHLRKAFSTLDI